LVRKILQAVVAAVNASDPRRSAPAGIRENKNSIGVAKIAEDAGIVALAVRPRETDLYRGEANLRHQPQSAGGVRFGASQ
jgi:tRNA-dihydrouridine synthase B